MLALNLLHAFYCAKGGGGRVANHVVPALKELTAERITEWFCMTQVKASRGWRAVASFLEETRLLLGLEK